MKACRPKRSERGRSIASENGGEKGGRSEEGVAGADAKEEDEDDMLAGDCE